MAKDLFSSGSADYAMFRPRYPSALFDWLANIAPARSVAWDCATGNGQAATELASRFARVIATDLSEAQIAAAERKPGVEYRVGTAEDSGLTAASVDLVAVAQAFHWFDAPKFYAECARVLRPGGVLAIWTYGLARITPEVDARVLHLYQGVLGSYWERERTQVDEGYASARLPGGVIEVPPFAMSAEWTFEQLLGYLSTWSALKTYRKQEGRDPLKMMTPELAEAWGDAKTRTLQWDLAVKASRLGERK